MVILKYMARSDFRLELGNRPLLFNCLSWPLVGFERLPLTGLLHKGLKSRCICSS